MHAPRRHRRFFSSDLRARSAFCGRPRASLRVLALVIATAVAGCGHYQLGTGGRVPLRTLYLEPVTNQAPLPQAEALLATQVRQAFVRDGRVELVNSPGAADAVLTLVISEYFREVAAVREDDTGLARKFNLTLGVNCTLKPQRGGAPGFEQRPIRAVREAFTDGGQLQSEYQTLPLLAEIVARKVVHAALDVW
jgi:hypothetical protein